MELKERASIISSQIKSGNIPNPTELLFFSDLDVDPYPITGNVVFSELRQVGHDYNARVCVTIKNYKGHPSFSQWVTLVELVGNNPEWAKSIISD